jgi:hypothetical protein
VLASFWAGVGGKLADRWASAAVPALIFWLGGLLAYAYHRNGISPITRSLARWTTPEQVAALVVALLVVGASAIVVQRLTLPWLRLLEGYWPGWCGPVREWMADRAWQQSVADEAAAQQLARFVYGADPTAAQLAQFARLEDRRHRRPEEQHRFMPTRAGNIIRAAELRPYRKYGLDAVVVWPRLWIVLPDAARQELLSARARLDGAAGAAVWGVLFCVFSGLTPWCAVAGLAVAGIAIWGWLPARAEVYGDLLEAAYDLHRTALYQQLRWPLPKDPWRERTQGERLTRYLLRGPALDDPPFTPPAP